MNGHANIDAEEATEHLKNILNLGKCDMDVLKPVSNGSLETSSERTSSEDKGYQKIELRTTKDSTHVAIYGKEVDVYSSPLEFEATCSEVFVDNMVDYGWEEKYYSGKLVSVHLSGKYLAYVLKPMGKPSGFVRLIHTEHDHRQLIKDYKSEVKDIAFAHTTAQVLLGSVDAVGELLVHKITDDGSNILCDLLIRMVRPSDWTASDHNHIIWCLYIPDENDTGEDEPSADDISTLLVVTHNERAEIWNVNTIIKEHNPGNLTMEDVKFEVQVISGHTMPITSATFSPDGTALAIASAEGTVKFFQVNTLDKDTSPRCLHKWMPHPDKTLSSLYFLDNHKNHKPDVQFWKVAVTGADNNTEIKIWGCETWVCLQTIRFHPSPADTVTPFYKAEIDLSSSYLFLSDIKRKVLLILLLQQDASANSPVVCSLSEYRVPLPVLSLAVHKVAPTKLHTLSDYKAHGDEDRDQGDSLTDSEDKLINYIIKLFWIQAKSLQSCRIIYKPKVPHTVPVMEPVTPTAHESFKLIDGLSDLSLETSHTDSPNTKNLLEVCSTPPTLR